MKKRTFSKVNKNLIATKINKLSLPYKKIKYCSLISGMIKKNNKMKNKISMIFSIIEFLSLHEKLNIRIVCKQWNEISKQILSHIFSKENYLNCIINNNVSVPGAIRLSPYKKRSESSSSTKKVQNLNLKNEDKKNYENELYFENSNKKFSKRKVLVKLINSKNFNTIKNKISLGDLTKSRNIFQGKM